MTLKVYRVTRTIYHGNRRFDAGDFVRLDWETANFHGDAVAIAPDDALIGVGEEEQNG